MRKRSSAAGRPASAPGGSSPDPGVGAPPVGANPAETTVSLLAGYRVVRRLGSSGRADVYLGHAGHRNVPARPEGADRPAGVALKVFRPETDPVSIERELRALTEVPAGRLPELVDVATLPDGRVCLVLERLAGTSLGWHLASVDGLEAGEAVTILAPVVTALAALHEAGFTHECLCQSTVRFDARGRPVLTGLGALQDLPPAGVGRIPALRVGYGRLGVLMRGVFDCLDPRDPAAPAAEQLAAWFEGAISDVPFRPCLDELERRLFGWAVATPVRLPGTKAAGTDASGPDRAGDDGAGEDGAGAHRSDPARASVPRVLFRSAALVPGAHEDVASDQQEVGRLSGWFALFHLPPEVRAAAAAALTGNAVTRGMARLRYRARLRRRPLLLAGVLAAALVLPALSLLPEPTASQQGRAQSGAAPDSADSPAAASETGSAGPGSASAGSSGARDTAALAGDDPVLALPVLLRQRAACLRQASVVCLDGVDQPGSAIMAEDGYVARSAQQGGKTGPAASFAGFAASLVERTGNSALVALAPPTGRTGPDSRPASVLVVKGEAGWRLREIFDY